MYCIKGSSEERAGFGTPPGPLYFQKRDADRAYFQLGNAIMLQTQKDATEIQKEMSTVTEQMHGLSREATQVHKDMSTVTKDIRNLSQGAAKDSAFISVISVLTALYVPGSFVGVSRGHHGDKNISADPDCRPSSA